ncbi:MAG TPA: type I-E CRISPR-associated protein Cas6/Cse3/CasE [bacterium]|nr:MAG: CRISPR system Cascade subunit CasE [bacterium ADurb.Bin236]HPI77255.1 type I-E CRISPR-associated protein Cas6/Cse3/CasE [bacterium]HPN93489.1 type I-E CRISPR-associated protein Cas6/Cse3/CasE [bacterium]
MYLSCLLINTGDNPDRPRPGRIWLRNLYRVHQRLCMAFPSSSASLADPDFLLPFKPDGFAKGHVHVPRKPDSGFLFRVDPLAGNGAAIIVQSASMPDWQYAFHNAGFLLSAEPQVKAFEPVFSLDMQYRFRLLANPTRKICTKTGEDGKRRNGKRVPVASDKLEEWLHSRAERAGFSVVKNSLSLTPSYVYVSARNENLKGQKLRSVRYDGVITITDADLFKEAVTNGIGGGKGFGFGLVSLARI